MVMGLLLSGSTKVMNILEAPPSPCFLNSQVLGIDICNPPREISTTNAFCNSALSSNPHPLTKAGKETFFLGCQRYSASIFLFRENSGYSFFTQSGQMLCVKLRSEWLFR